MAGKNDSTRHTAPIAVEEPSPGQSKPAQQRQPAQQPTSENEHPPAYAKDETEQRAMEPRSTSQEHKVPRGMLDRSLQAQLGRQLRAIFSDVASEPVPDRFVKLLEELAAREKRR